MNKHILLVMKWLRDNDSVTVDELRMDADASAAATAYAASCAANNDADYASEWVEVYFNRTGDNRADYETQLNKDAEMKEEVKAVYTQGMCDAGELPPVGCIVKYKETGGTNWCTCEIIAIHKGKIWIDNLSLNSQPFGRASKFEFKPIDNRTDEDHLIDDICNTLSRSKTVVGYRGDAINLLQDFNITRKEK